MADRWNGRATGITADHLWAQRAKDCPHSPDVLRLAAVHELARRVSLPARYDEVELDPVVKELTESRRQVLTWLETAEQEEARRGLRPGHHTAFARAHARLSLGEANEALRLLKAGVRDGSISASEARPAMAIAHLQMGELDESLRLARLGGLGNRESMLRVSLYTYAMALDRAGETATASRLMVRTHGRDGDSTGFFRAISMLPLHEQLYLMALERFSMGDAAAAIRLWTAYLVRPEPAEAERKLAERHLAEIESGRLFPPRGTSS